MTTDPEAQFRADTIRLARPRLHEIDLVLRHINERQEDIMQLL